MNNNDDLLKKIYGGKWFAFENPNWENTTSTTAEKEIDIDNKSLKEIINEFQKHIDSMKDSILAKINTVVVTDVLGKSCVAFDNILVITTAHFLLLKKTQFIKKVGEYYFLSNNIEVKIAANIKKELNL